MLMENKMGLLTGVILLASGAQRVIEATDAIRMTIIAGAGATVTVSRVNSRVDTAHTTGAHNQFTVAADSRTTTDVDWPYYLVSTAGGACRVGLI